MGDRIIEIAAAALLAIAALATSWSGYQSSRWSGASSLLLNRADGLRVESSRADTEADQLRSIDVILFCNWVDAYSGGRSELEAFYRKRFRPEFAPAFEAWLATKPRRNPAAPTSPFVLPEYRIELKERADSLLADAERTGAGAREANDNGDAYVLNTVFFASVLFFTGFAQQFRRRSIRVTLLGMAILLCAVAVYRTITMPVS